MIATAASKTPAIITADIVMAILMELRQARRPCRLISDSVDELNSSNNRLYDATSLKSR